MNSIKVCEYSRSRSFHDDLILQDQASGERSQDHWSSGLCLYRPVCVGPVRKPHCWFSHEAAHIMTSVEWDVKQRLAACLFGNGYYF